MDVTPLVPAGRQIIESYGEGRFRVGGTLHAGSILVFPIYTSDAVNGTTQNTRIALTNIDPVRNVSGVILMQVLPFADHKCLEAFAGFETGVYAGLDAGSGQKAA